MNTQSDISNSVVQSSGPSSGARQPRTADAADQYVLTGVAERHAAVKLVLERVDGSGGPIIAFTRAAAVADEQGAYPWAFDCSTLDLADGTYNVTAQQIDISGNASPVSQPYQLVVGTPPFPAALAIVDYSPDLVSGTANPGASVRVVNDTTGRALGTVKAGSDGAWMLDLKAYEGVSIPLLGTGDAISAVAIEGLEVSEPVTVHVMPDRVGRSADMAADTDGGETLIEAYRRLMNEASETHTPTTPREDASADDTEGSVQFHDINGDGAPEFVIGDNGLLHVLGTRSSGTDEAESGIGHGGQNEIAAASWSPFQLLLGPAPAPAAPTIDRHNPGLMAGTAGPGAFVRVVNETTGRTLGTVQADGEGLWKLEINARSEHGQTPSHPRPGIGDTISAIVVDGGNASEPATAEVTQELVYLYSYNGGTTTFLSTFLAGDDGAFAGMPARTNLVGGRAGRGYYRFAELADIDGDGILDYVTGNVGVIDVAYGRADGTFDDAVQAAFLPTANLPTESSHLTDFDADGRADYVYLRETGEETIVEAYRGLGNGTFSLAARTSLLDVPGGSDVNSFVRLVDMNGDGTAELVIGDAGTVSVFQGRPDGTFSGTPVVSELPTGVDYHKSRIFGDFDGDGLVDYLFSHMDHRAGEAGIQVFRGLTAEGSFGQEAVETVIPAGGDAGPRTYGWGRVADIDQDGTLDYVADNNGALDVFPGRGDGTFSSAPDMAVPVPLTGSPKESMLLTALFMEDKFDTIEGWAGLADSLTGTDRAERILGHGNRDEIDAGGGDDFIFLPDLDFHSLEGGEGMDMLILTGSDLTLDLAGAHRGKVQGVEQIDLTGSGANALVLSSGMLSQSDPMRVFGDGDDTVHLTGFSRDGEVALDGRSFDVYTDGTSFVSVAHEVGAVVT